MKKVIFSTNLPSPYRVDFFNELGKYCDLTVLYERKRSSERDKKWVGESAKNFKEIYLNLEPVGTDRSKGSALKDYIKTASFDFLFFTNYVSQSTMEAITYCRFHHIPYYIEYDGGFNKKDQFLKRLLKKFLLGGAKGHFTTADEHKKYLMSLGINRKIIYKYPFTSIRKSDISVRGSSSTEKVRIREQINIIEDKMILSVGQFIYRKGFDILIKAMSQLDQTIGLYIVGGKPTEEYEELLMTLNLHNVHFVEFKTKTELKEYYRAADLFVFPTREDIWGLVINEAMAQGLPVVSTNRCIAALEMVEDGKNGLITESENENSLAESMKEILFSDNYGKLQSNSINKAKEYTIEKMAESHMQLVENIVGSK